MCGDRGGGREYTEGSSSRRSSVHRAVRVWCHACAERFLIVVGRKCVCEMLIRHECCGVGAPGSGGGTPCATSQRERGREREGVRDGGALVLQEP